MIVIDIMTVLLRWHDMEILFVNKNLKDEKPTGSFSKRFSNGFLFSKIDAHVLESGHLTYLRHGAKQTLKRFKMRSAPFLFLNPCSFNSCKLISVETLTKNTKGHRNK